MYKDDSFRLLSELYSLLSKENSFNEKLFEEFPSPIGVIFSLMDIIVMLRILEYHLSFRLLSELYSLLLVVEFVNGVKEFMFPSPIGVIFSLIVSWAVGTEKEKKVSVSYRSYILSYAGYVYGQLVRNRFRLLSELYSLLYTIEECLELQDRFPSPIGVIFSLIYEEFYTECMKLIPVSVSYRSYILSYF